MLSFLLTVVISHSYVTVSQRVGEPSKSYWNILRSSEPRTCQELRSSFRRLDLQRLFDFGYLLTIIIRINYTIYVNIWIYDCIYCFTLIDCDFDCKLMVNIVYYGLCFFPVSTLDIQDVFWSLSSKGWRCWIWMGRQLSTKRAASSHECRRDVRIEHTVHTGSNIYCVCQPSDIIRYFSYRVPYVNQVTSKDISVSWSRLKAWRTTQVVE